MGLFSNSVEEKILLALERIAEALERQNPPFLSPRTGGDYRDDRSEVTYLDDIAQIMKEAGFEDYLNRTGIELNPNFDTLPSPVDATGKEWVAGDTRSKKE